MLHAKAMSQSTNGFNVHLIATPAISALSQYPGQLLESLAWQDWQVRYIGNGEGNSLRHVRSRPLNGGGVSGEVVSLALISSPNISLFMWNLVIPMFACRILYAIVDPELLVLLCEWHDNRKSQIARQFFED